jgi:hypothetical protein
MQRDSETQQACRAGRLHSYSIQAAVVAPQKLWIADRKLALTSDQASKSRPVDSSSLGSRRSAFYSICQAQLLLNCLLIRVSLLILQGSKVAA